MSRLNGNSLFALTIAAVLLADQLSKRVVRETLSVGESFPDADALLGKVFSFTRVSNTGIAFGMFQGRSELFVATSLTVVAAILVYRTRMPANQRWLQVAFGLQVGGALGNVIDRLTLGPVTDFLDFKVWPVFNFSDLSIFTGTMMLVWYLWQEERNAAAEGPPEGDPLGTSGPSSSGAVEPASPQPDSGPVPRQRSALAPAIEERGD